jgi:hypothetical protein
MRDKEKISVRKKKWKKEHPEKEEPLISEG